MYRASDVMKTTVRVITGLKVHITTQPAKNLEKFTIGIGTTNENQLSKWVKTDVYLGPKTLASHETQAVLKLDKPFEWDQKSNIVFEFIWVVSTPQASGNAVHVLLPGTVLKASGNAAIEYSNLSSLPCEKSSENVLITLVGKSRSVGVEFYAPKGFTPKLITDGKTSIPIKQDESNEMR
jgi:hypothetical protein